MMPGGVHLRQLSEKINGFSVYSQREQCSTSDPCWFALPVNTSEDSPPLWSHFPRVVQLALLMLLAYLAVVVWDQSGLE